MTIHTLPIRSENGWLMIRQAINDVLRLNVVESVVIPESETMSIRKTCSPNRSCFYESLHGNQYRKRGQCFKFSHYS